MYIVHVHVHVRAFAPGPLHVQHCNLYFPHDQIDGSDFEELCDCYSYPTEDSDTVVDGVQCDLTCDNYQSKYHKLVYLDDLEHARKMAQEWVIKCSHDVILYYV